MIFIDLFKRYIKYHKSAVKPEDKRSYTTIMAYGVKKDLFEHFLGEKGVQKITAQKINMPLMDEYFEYLLRKGYKHDYAMRCTVDLKSVLRFGVRKGIIASHRLSEYFIKKSIVKKPVYISHRELSRIEAFQPTNSTMKKAKDMFLSQCYMGFDYGCLTSVRQHHITLYNGIEYIVKIREKGKEKNPAEACIPYFDKFEKIFKENNYNMGLLCNSGYNVALKDLMKLCDVQTYLMSHTGRKTFAMHMLNTHGYSLEACSKMLGHLSIRTTEIYYARPELKLVHNEHLKHAN